ncbi:MAG: 50S ribosomal protein L19 [Elusimicrobia bacterium]|nr:50S ribosomal protein L19 [Elusimicrobiota bacterium]
MIEMIDKQLRKDMQDFKPGDDVRVNMRSGEDKKRIQSFEGLVIGIKGEGLNKTFTVRKYSFGVGVEKVFSLHSPLIDSVEILKRGKVRRAKLYYMRKRYGKAARIKEKREY